LPKRVLDGEAIWGSTKLSECPEWAIPFYAWIYPLADANGSFELTNLRVIWCKVAAILPNFTLVTLTEVLRTFEDRGLLFVWSENGKRYGHWTGSEKPGRLPQPARRTVRYGPMLAPPIPREQLQEYQLRQQECRTATAQASLCDSGRVAGGDSFGVAGFGVGVGLGVGEGKEGASDGDAPQAQAETPPSPFVFPGLHLKVSSRQDKLLAEAFPWVDRPAEYRKAESWLDANPKKRPRKTNPFLHNWFARIPAPKSNGGVNRADVRTRSNAAAAGFRPN
jgi:hypothetical protein